jgi:L-fucose mutarotase
MEDWMLYGIPDILCGDLLKILADMGHGDELVIGDANFPAASSARRLVRLDGHGVPAVLEAVLGLFPLDDFVPAPVSVMEVVKGDPTIPYIQDGIRGIVARHDPRGAAAVGAVDRYGFYERARNAYAVIATSERNLYGCIILKKGVIRIETR